MLRHHFVHKKINSVKISNIYRVSISKLKSEISIQKQKESVITKKQREISPVKTQQEPRLPLIFEKRSVSQPRVQKWNPQFCLQ